MKTPFINVLEKHSRILRWSHWLNVPLLFLMIWSGIKIYWAHQAYIKIPDTIANSLGISFHLAEGMGWHFFIMWPFFINGIIYFLYLVFSGEWRNRIPLRSSFKNSFLVLLHDLKIIKKAPPQIGIYNDAQRIAYTGTFFLGMGALITGIAIYKPVQAGWLTAILGGYKAARFEHFLIMNLFVLFFFIHIVQVVRAGWNNLRSMIAGFELENK